LPWEKAKAFDFSAPVSSFIPVAEFDDIQQIAFSLKKNGDIVQNGNTKDMIFSYPAIIAYVSQFMTLKTGDYIFTGTPAGVGPVAIGDKLEAYIGEKKMLTVNIK
jgi:acylpyruvate hydrolase